jgi:hypothetical protein
MHVVYMKNGDNPAFSIKRLIDLRDMAVSDGANCHFRAVDLRKLFK